jgi:DNA-binding CsgD family transcriptional regulator
LRRIAIFGIFTVLAVLTTFQEASENLRSVHATSGHLLHGLTKNNRLGAVMAVFDPTKISLLREGFPELSDTEFEVSMLFAHGASIDEISEMRDMSIAMVKKTLYLSKNKLNLPSSNSIKVITHLRVNTIILSKLSS